jgi:hypothetical protein
MLRGVLTRERGRSCIWKNFLRYVKQVYQGDEPIARTLFSWFVGFLERFTFNVMLNSCAESPLTLLTARGVALWTIISKPEVEISGGHARQSVGSHGNLWWPRSPERGISKPHVLANVAPREALPLLPLSASARLSIPGISAEAQ